MENIKLIKKNNIICETISKSLEISKIIPEFLDYDERLKFNPIIMDFIDLQTKLLWTVNEIDYDEDDIKKFNTLSNHIQTVINSIILFFTVADKLVISNLDNLKKVPYESVLNFYKLQEYIESIHDQIYRKSAILYYNNNEKYLKDVELLNEIIKKSEEFPDEIFDLNNYECDYFNKKSDEEKKIFYAVSLKVNLVNKWKNLDSYVHNLVAFFIIESISFNCLFIIINIFKKKNNGLKYLIDINELVSRDENVHALFGLEFYKTFILNKLPEDELIMMVKEITEVEKKFISILINDLILENYTLNDFTSFLENLANVILNELGIKNCYDITHKIPEEFNLQSLKIKTNFFERTNLYITKDKIIKKNNILNCFK